MDLFALDKIILDAIKNLSGYQLLIISVTGFIGITVLGKGDSNKKVSKRK